MGVQPNKIKMDSILTDGKNERQPERQRVQQGKAKQNKPNQKLPIAHKLVMNAMLIHPFAQLDICCDSQKQNDIVYTDFMFNSWLATVKDLFCQISFLHQQSVLFHLMHHNLVVTKSTLQHGTLFPLHTEGGADFSFNIAGRRSSSSSSLHVYESWQTLANAGNPSLSDYGIVETMRKRGIADSDVSEVTIIVCWGGRQRSNHHHRPHLKFAHNFSSRPPSPQNLPPSLTVNIFA